MPDGNYPAVPEPSAQITEMLTQHFRLKTAAAAQNFIMLYRQHLQQLSILIKNRTGDIPHQGPCKIYSMQIGAKWRAHEEAAVFIAAGMFKIQRGKGCGAFYAVYFLQCCLQILIAPTVKEQISNALIVQSRNTGVCFHLIHAAL